MFSQPRLLTVQYRLRGRVLGTRLHESSSRELQKMKHHIVHFLQKYLFNPPIKLLFAIGMVPPGYALLETIGRKTGKPRRTPVGNGRVDGQFWIVAEHGQKAGYVRNIVASPRVRVKLRDGLRARWYAGTANLLAEDDPRERQQCRRGPLFRHTTAHGSD
jgi:deazaflavin-dependent oxidoreductase (nitroreductase family)